MRFLRPNQRRPSSPPPPDPLRAELEAYLEADQTRLRDVYRGLSSGLDAEAIAAEAGVGTSNFVWNYSKIIDALLQRELPQAPTVALQTSRRYRTLLKNNWSPEVRERLERGLETLERRATDVEAIAEETITAREQTARAEEGATTGIGSMSTRSRITFAIHSTPIPVELS